MPAPDSLAPALERIVAERQADRLPSVAGGGRPQGRAGLVRRGRERPTTPRIAPRHPETQYRIGSITKTFTATAIMQLRDAGALDLDDRLEQHLPGIANGDADAPPPALPPLRACSARRGRCS